MIAHSLWEQGRDIASGKIVSMTPFDSAGIGQVFGGAPLGAAGMALSAVAQFGIYFEMRRMNLLKEAGFEERRHAWIDDISRQWIEEHRTESGVVRDVSTVAAIEFQKMWEKVCENEKADVPQSLLLRISRICEFLDWNYKVAATASNEVVIQSNSEKSWVLDTELDSKSIATDLVRSQSDETRKTKGEWWKGPAKLVGGIPLFFVPFVGGCAAGGAWGAGLVETITYLRTAHIDFERLGDKIPLLQFGIAVERLESASNQLAYLLDKQDFELPMRLYALERNPGNVIFMLEGSTDGPGETGFQPSLKPIRMPNNSIPHG